jgi:lysophospholipase L1-like esterase
LDSLAKTRDWIVSKLQSYGYSDILQHNFADYGTTLTNIIATKTGAVYPDSIVILSSHYDTVNGPGVDDDGAGVAITLEAARILASKSFDCTVRFIFFTAEEVGLDGSRAYVQYIAVPNHHKIRIMINNDMVGYSAGMNLVNVQRDTLRAGTIPYADTLAKLTELYTSLDTRLSIARNADFATFAYYGYLTTGFHEVIRTPYYHTQSDSLKYMNPEWTTEIAKGSLAGVAYFALSGGMTIQAAAGPNGTISPSGAVRVYKGGSMHFSIIPNTGYHVDSLIVDGARVATDTQYTFSNIQTGHNIRTVFAQNIYTITASAGANGSILPSGTVTVMGGSSKHFSFVADSGYHVDSVFVDGILVATDTQYTFTNIAASHTIRVTFIKTGAVAAKIMPLGDSITGSTCYPPFLWEDLQSGGYSNVSYVGTVVSNGGSGITCANISYYQTIEAHGGYSSSDLASGLPGWLSTLASLGNVPDVVIMHAGSNNFWNGTSPSLITATLANYTTMLNSMRSSNPAVKLIVCQVIPMCYSPASYAGTMMLDDSIPAWAALNSTLASPIFVADLRTGFDTTSYYDDAAKTHPNSAGSKFMADRVYAVLTAVMGIHPSGDTVKPVVAITSPANGDTVSGTKTIAASASDNVKVTSVQFALDGANLGAAITSSPYTYSWNTTQASNGSHTIAAIARDSAGNSSTATISVTVSNTIPSTQDLWVYQEALASPWINASWAATITFGSAEQAYAGSNSIKVVQSSGGALSLHNGYWNAAVPINPMLYSGVEFAIHGGASGLTISVLCQSDSGTSFPWVSCGTVAANTWQVISVPMSQLSPSNRTFDRFDILERSSTSKTYYVDNLRFIGVASSKTVARSPIVESAPTAFMLEQNYPNPFNPTTMLRFALPEASDVRLIIYNVLGQVVKTFADGTQEAGYHEVEWNASNVASGLYFYRIDATSVSNPSERFSQTRKMILIK